MSTPRFNTLKVKDVRRETEECVSIAFEIPVALEADYRFKEGQHLTLKTNIDGEEVRRSYSVCVSPLDGELRVAVKKMYDGKFSSFANSNLKAGDELEVMTPMGKFHAELNPAQAKNYLAFAAGSGITPIMSIMKTILKTEPNSTFTLVFGNQNRNTIIFKEEIEGLKNRYMTRLSVYHILSREIIDIPLFSGRIDKDKCLALSNKLIDLKNIDDVFLCGPEEMIFNVKDVLKEAGMTDKQIHFELFDTKRGDGKREKWLKENEADAGKVSKVTVRLDGVTFDMDVPYGGDTILDAALKHGADLPYACKGGVCCTCKAKVTEGEVNMVLNYGLEPDEVEKKFVLTCQAHPQSEKVFIDFDAR